MITLNRYDKNPILLPSNVSDWEAKATYNGCVIKDNDTFHMVYRAQAKNKIYQGHDMSPSSIGYAAGIDGKVFTNHYQLIKPDHQWELYGCEDPRITKMNDKYFIFYTALSNYPFSAPGIRIGLAITKDFINIEEKHIVTPFNAKAMCLFPEKINGKIVALLTANTEILPAKIALAFFDSEKEIWSDAYWKNWYEYVNDHTLNILRSDGDQVEIGAPPIKTKDGWLILYSYIKNYFSNDRLFTIEALLLDNDDPTKIIGRIADPLLIPEKDYEKYGEVKDIVFPTGAVVNKDELLVYYGAADTSVCLATVKISDILSAMKPIEKTTLISKQNDIRFERFAENPIIRPDPENAWEAKATFNPAAIFIDNKTHIVYRAVSDRNISVFGYAESSDGYHITNRFKDPIYIPREDFEKNDENKNAGCEDPRITQIGDSLYMCYTAYNGHSPPRIALTSISVADFLAKRWSWEKPRLISLPGVDDKDACIMPDRIDGKFVFFHRLDTSIWIDFVNTLDVGNEKYITGRILIQPRPTMWDSVKIGISAPPIKTEKGWLLIYHGIDQNRNYHVGAILLDLLSPNVVLGQSLSPLLSPLAQYEKEGVVGNVVFPCGALLRNDLVFIYYGGADLVSAVATMPLQKILSSLV